MSVISAKGIRITLAIVIFATSKTLSPYVFSDERATLLVLPVYNEAKLSMSEANYFSDVVWDICRKNTPSGQAMVSRQEASKVVGSNVSRCDEQCAISAGKKVEAEKVVLVEIKKLKKEYRIVAKLINPGVGETISLEREKAENVVDIEDGLESAVARLFGKVTDSRSETESGIAPTPSQPTSIFEPAGYGQLSVVAKGVKEGGTEEEQCAAEVFINGSAVGYTPFGDGFPPGKYAVEIRAYDQVAKQVVDVVTDQQYEVSTVFKIPLSQEEIAAIEAEKLQRQEEEKRALEESYREAMEAWQKERFRWEKEANEIRGRRKPKLVAGLVLAPVGLAMVITGIVLEYNAVVYNDNYNDYKDLYQKETLEQKMVVLEEKMDEQKNKRDLANGFGIAGLAVGGAALITSIVLFIVMEKLPDEPEQPRQVSLGTEPRIAVSPLIGPRIAGLGVGFSF